MRLSTNKNSRKTSKSKTHKDAGSKPVLLWVCVLALLFLLGAAARPIPKVHVKKLKDNSYQLIVDRNPYIVKGVCYNPIPVGLNYEHDWWSDPNKPWLVDAKLMQEMGVNTIRIYQTGADTEAVKTVIRDLYKLYGIRTILGHWLGFWEPPFPLYGDKDFQEKIKKEVIEMVNTYKDEPGILLWILGNENNFSAFGRVNPWSSEEIDKEPDPQKRNAMRAKIYYSFVNDIAKEIHKIDPDHPVAFGNGELVGLDYANQFCQEVDLLACIIYRGKSFGNIFESLRSTFDKPILLAEFGADCYDAYLNTEDQGMQAYFLLSQWQEIYQNLSINKKEGGSGNCIGGTVFEWSDEWWKHNEADAETWNIHDTESNWSNGAYYFDIKVRGNKNMNEEWFGIVALSQELENGLNKRLPRKAYYSLRDFWKNPDIKTKIESPVKKAPKEAGIPID